MPTVNTNPLKSTAIFITLFYIIMYSFSYVIVFSALLYSRLKVQIYLCFSATTRNSGSACSDDLGVARKGEISEVAS